MLKKKKLYYMNDNSSGSSIEGEYELADTSQQEPNESDESYLARITLLKGEDLRLSRNRDLNDVLDRYFAFEKMATRQNQQGEGSLPQQQQKTVTHATANRKETNGCILSNSNFEDWFKLICIELGREGIKELLLASDDETKFVELDVEKRMTQMKEYDLKQDIGLSVIFDRMPANLRSRVRDCCTVRSVVEKLKKEL